MGYNEICEELKEPNNGWNVTFDKHHQAPYMAKGVKWVSYDDEMSIRKKSQFAYDQVNTFDIGTFDVATFRHYNVSSLQCLT
jgi:GH18 family chitinase